MSSASFQDRIRAKVASARILDIHTHLYDPAFGKLLLSGIDELLIYHYLVAEGFRQSDISAEAFWRATPGEQAAFIWKALFIEHSPISEACRGVLTVLQALGIDARAGDLESIRQWFRQQNPARHMDRILSLAGVSGIGMTNSPFDDLERPYWESPVARDPRFFAALRIDPLLVDWPNASKTLRQWGYDVGGRTTRTADEVRRFLADWTRRIDSRYCMVSLPPSFAYPASTDTAWLIDHAVLPHGREMGQPLALMMGVKRAVNPSLRLAGDGVGRSDLDALQALCAANTSNRFLVTCLSRENQHELVVLARKFRNLHPFGCWWFTNTPQLIGEITTMRLELLGTAFTPQHSDARVVEQLIYKWNHSRTIIGDCMAQKYSEIVASGWEPTDAEIDRDIHDLFGGSFTRFCKS